MFDFNSYFICQMNYCKATLNRENQGYLIATYPSLLYLKVLIVSLTALNLLYCLLLLCQPVPDNDFSAWCQYAFGMKLHPLHIILLVFQPHDTPLLINSLNL